MILIELSKKKKRKTYWRPFVEYLADIVVYFYLQNPYGKKKKKNKKTKENPNNIFCYYKLMEKPNRILLFCSV